MWASDPRFKLVPDGAHLDVAFHGAEGGLGFGELYIRLPELRRFVRAAGPVGAQEVGSVAVDGGFSFLLVPLPLEAAAFAGAVLEEAPAGAVALLKMGDASLDGLLVLELAFGDEIAQFGAVADAGFGRTSSHGAFLVGAALAAAKHIDIIGGGAELDLHLGGCLLPAPIG